MRIRGRSALPFRSDKSFLRKKPSWRTQLALERLEDRLVLDGQSLLVPYYNDAVPTAIVGVESISRVDGYDNLFRVDLFDGVDANAVLDAYNNDPHVEYVEPNYEIQLNVTPNDTYFDHLWGLNNDGQQSGTPDADIDAVEAWDNVNSGEVIVAILDTGIDYTHPDLQDNIWRNTGEIAGNGIDDDNNGFVDDYYGYHFNIFGNDSDPFDGHSHGTHVAGTVAATGNNSFGVTGVAYQVASVMAVKVLSDSGSGYTSDIAAGIRYAVDNGATVINASLGGGGYSQTLYNAINYARQNNVLFVAAAGNNGSNNDSRPTYPASYNLDNIISVAATDRNDQLASFSNYGQSVDLGAPGVSILSTVPGGYSFYSGTSMAAPHVAGAAAVLRSQIPGASYADIKNLLLENVDVVSGLNNLVATDGRLNLNHALAAAQPPADTTAPFVTNFVAVNAPNYVTSATIQFSEAVQSFTIADLSLTGPGDISGLISSLTPNSSGTEWTVTFSSPLDAGGQYTLVVGPAITDLAGNTMTQSFVGQFEVVQNYGITIVESSGSTSVAEGGATDTYTIVLDSTPTADVTITITAGGQLTANPATVVFTADNWDSPQTITVRAVDDNNIEGTHGGTIVHSATSSDAGYNAISIENVTVNISDNDQAPPPAPEPEPSSDLIYFSLASRKTFGSLRVENEDIVAFDGTNYSILFDGSDLGLHNLRIDAFDVIDESNILISFDTASGNVDDSDVLLFQATSLGENTAGTFYWYLDGSDVGLTQNREDIDGVTLLDDGSLLVSTSGRARIGRARFEDEDVFRFLPSSLGSVTSGTFEAFLDGSNPVVGLGEEDVDGFAVKDGQVYFTTAGSFSVPGLSGQDEDIFVFDLQSQTYSLYLDLGSSDVRASTSAVSQVLASWQAGSR